MSIGDRIKQLRGGLSRDELAKSLNLHKNTLANYEMDSRVPDANFLQQLLIIYPETSADWLLTGNGLEHKKEITKIDKEMFAEVMEAVEEMLPNESLRRKAETITDYYNFFADAGFKATKKDVISFAKFSIELSDKLVEFGGISKIKEIGIKNLVNIIESITTPIEEKYK